MHEAAFEDALTLGTPPAIAQSQWVVMKFGGTSVATAANWHAIAALVKRRLDEGLRPVVVHSALSGISTALEKLLEAAVAGQGEPLVAEIAARHEALARDLGIDPAPLYEHLQELEHLTAGVRLTGEVTPRVHARVLSLGELMATRIGAAALAQAGVDAAWHNATQLLTSANQRNRSERQRYLSAVCDFEADADLRETLAAAGPVVITQGFIAGNPRGETVLLGRGGSDTSAAYFAAHLRACRLEIWTDVPGMFSADPRLVPSARLLTALHYDEALEIASTGSSVLHPRCLPPVRHHGIPLYVRSTPRPDLDGTVISAATGEAEPHVKAISLRSGLTLVSMEGLGMWQEVGFMAEAFAAFSRHGLSVDHVSTSETNVTVSVDIQAGALSDDALAELVDELGQLCRVQLIQDCAAISLVGRKIRTILHQLGPAMEVFEEQRIHLLTQAASDLNLSFVVDEDQGKRLVRELHASCVRPVGGDDAFGPTWETLYARAESLRDLPTPWWRERRDELLSVGAEHGPCFVYDLASVDRAIAQLSGLTAVDAIFYAMKANPNRDVLRRVHAGGGNFECVSPGELRRVLELFPDIDRRRILFTPNFAPRDEYALGLELGVWLTLDNLHPLREWPEMFRGCELFIRLDPGQGRGHHEHVRTAGVHSKFGIPLFELDELAALVVAAGCTVVGIHAHSGSGILDPRNWRDVARALAEAAGRFPAVHTLDLGGGLGVPEKPGDPALDLDELGALLAELRAAWPHYRLWLEPGRYVVAEAGVLLAAATQTKGKGDVRYVGVATGMNSLIRPALYGAYHEIVNLTRLDEPATEQVTVVGPICESGDRLGTDRLLPPTVEGDILLVANAGAYGRAMASRYNLREPAAELVV